MNILGFLVTMVVLFSGCSMVTDGGVKVLEREVVLTGEPAVDASIPFLSEIELKSAGIIAPGLETEAVISNTAVSVYGPLHDRRAVRGKKLEFSYFANNTALTYTLRYGYSPTTLTSSIVLAANTNNGNRKALITVPANAGDRLYFKITDSAGNTYGDYNGQPYYVRVYDRIVSYGYAMPYNPVYAPGVAGYLTVNYAGPVSGAATILHYGFDNWQNVKDTNMQYYTASAYYGAADYASVTLELTSTVSMLDFVFRSGNAWDNNGGADFHQTLKPLVICDTTSLSASGKYVNILYANGRLNAPIFAHYGTDGWKGVNDVQLYTETYQGSWLGYYTKSVRIDPNARVFDVCFRDQNNNWENNGGKDWHFDVERPLY